MTPENRKAFESSLIKEGWFDPKEKELTILFAVGKKYVYYGVTKETWEELYNSESAGQYFTKNIKGKYNYRAL